MRGEVREEEKEAEEEEVGEEEEEEEAKEKVGDKEDEGEAEEKAAMRRKFYSALTRANLCHPAALGSRVTAPVIEMV